MNRFVLCVLVALFLAVGCASDKSAQPGSAAREGEPLPRVGMTKEEVIALFGKTDIMLVSGTGEDFREAWFYRVNLAGAYLLAQRLRYRIVVFDREGRVKSWSYDK